MGCFQSKPEYEPPRPTRAAPAGPVSHEPTKVALVPAPAVAIPIPRAKVEITDADRAKHKLKHTRDVLDRTMTNSETVLIRDLSLAKTLHSEGKKESALVLLRRRKLIEKRIAVTKVQLEKIENSLSTLEGAENMNTILSSIEQSTRVIDQLNKLVTVDRAEKIMQDSRDSVAYTAEVAAVLVEDNEAQETEDDDEILEQIRMFEEEEGTDDEILNTTPEQEALKTTPEPEKEVIKTAPEEEALRTTPAPEEEVITTIPEPEEVVENVAQYNHIAPPPPPKVNRVEGEVKQTTHKVPVAPPPPPKVPIVEEVEEYEEEEVEAVEVKKKRKGARAPVMA